MNKSWFFEKLNKIDKPLARLIKKQREKNQINKIRNENGEITTDNTEIQDHQITISNYMPVKRTTWKKWTNSQKSTTFPKLNQEEMENLNRHITSTEIEL